MKDGRRDASSSSSASSPSPCLSRAAGAFLVVVVVVMCVYSSSSTLLSEVGHTRTTPERPVATHHLPSLHKGKLALTTKC